MPALELDEVKSALSGVWDNARARFWLSAADAAARDGEWATVANRLLHLADPLDTVPAGEAAWRELAVTSFDAAVRAGSVDIVRTVANRMLDRAWPAGDAPDELVPVFRHAERQLRYEPARVLGAIIERRYPRSAWSIYAHAHFVELSIRSGQGPDRHIAPEQLATRFEAAGDLFDAASEPGSALHCRLRAGVIWMTWTSRTDRGRTLLRAASGPDLAPDDRRWLAFAQAHSPFWLDRVRAADWVGDTIDRLGQDSDDRALFDAHTVADVLFSRLPVKLSGSEIDRLESVLDAFDDDRRWELEAQLRGREVAAVAAARALDDVTVAEARELEQECLPLDGFAPLVEAWKGGAPSERPKGAVAAAVVDFLVALSSGDSRARIATARSLARVIVETPGARDYRPVLLALTRAIPADLDDAQFAEIVTELAIHFADRDRKSVV